MKRSEQSIARARILIRSWLFSKRNTDNKTVDEYELREVFDFIERGILDITWAEIMTEDILERYKSAIWMSDSAYLAFMDSVLGTPEDFSAMNRESMKRFYDSGKS